MIVKFDALNRFERPLFHLCNPGTKYEQGVLTRSIGILSDTSDEEIEYNFNTTSVLSLRAYRHHFDDPEQDKHFRALFKKIQNKRLIFVDDVGFFVIKNVTDGLEDGVKFKDIEAESCEAEMSDKKLPYIEDGTYPFEEILDNVVGTVPMWTVAHIDESLKTLYRTFEDVDTEQNVLSFLLEDMQDAYECIFLFDPINRRISVYDQNSYVRETGVQLSYDDIVNSLEVSDDSEDMYTAISVYGDSDLTISAVNPLGTSTLYNFDYYLDWMTPELRAKVVEWQRLIRYYSNADKQTPDNDNYMLLGQKYADAYTEYINSGSQLGMLNIQLNMYQRCYDNISAVAGNSLVPSYNDVLEQAGGELIPENIEDVKELQSVVSGLIDKAKAAIEAEKQNQDALDKKAQGIWDQMLAINKKISITTYFSPAEYEELSCYISEGTYTDEYVTITDSMTYAEQFEQLRTLYERAVRQLEKISKPTQEFSIDVENFLFQKQFEHHSKQLETGCVVNVELDEDDIAPLFLATIRVNYDDLELELTFGNRFCRFDPKAMFQDVLGDVRRSANTIEYMKDLLHPIKEGAINQLREYLADSRNLTKGLAMAATNQAVILDDSGYTGKKQLGDGDFDPKQVKITNNNLLFTDDWWETCDVAIGELTFVNEKGETITTMGVNAHALIGDIIIGSELHILYSTEESGDYRDLVDDLVQLDVSVEGVTARVEEVKTEAITESNKHSDDALQAFVDGDFADTIEELQKQDDAKAETWYQNGDPSTAWTDATQKAEHKGDMWFCTDKENDTYYGRSWRWDGNKWQEMTSNPPQEVFDTIDGKAQVFVNTPTVPYNEGDLWFNSITSDILTCMQGRGIDEAYNAGDWVKRNKYTDDSTANAVNQRVSELTVSVEGVTARVEDKTTGLDAVWAELGLKIGTDDTGQIISMINAVANQVTITSDNFTLSADGTIVATNGTFSGAITGGTIGIGGAGGAGSNFYVDADGNVTLRGNITWGAANSPVQVAYSTARSTPAQKPADGTKYTSIPDTGTEAWHKTVTANDKYASYTYDGGATWTNPVKIVGTDGAAGTTITSTVVEYVESTSGIVAPGSGWSTNMPDVTPGNYLWTRTTTKYSVGSDTVAYSVSRNGTNGGKGDPGDPGKDGAPGKDGSSIRTVQTPYATTQENIDNYAQNTMGYRVSNVEDLDLLKEGDQVMLKLKNTTTGDDAFIFGTVTNVNKPDSQLWVRGEGKVRSGKDGSDATVTRQSICEAILQSLMSADDGIYSYTDAYGNYLIGLNATAIRAGILDADNVTVRGNIKTSNVTFSGDYGGFAQGQGSWRQTPTSADVTTYGVVMYGSNGLDGYGNAIPPYFMVTDKGMRGQVGSDSFWYMSGNNFVVRGNIVSQQYNMFLDNSHGVYLAPTTGSTSYRGLYIDTNNTILLGNKTLNTTVEGNVLTTNANDVSGFLGARQLFWSDNGATSGNFTAGYQLYVFIGKPSSGGTMMSLVVPGGMSYGNTFQIADESNFSRFSITEGHFERTAGTGSIICVFALK